MVAWSYMQARSGQELARPDGVDGYFIQADRSSLAQVQTQLQALCDRHGVFLHSFADITRIIEGMMVSIDGCMWGILILGFVVAALGVINTLTMNVLEQTREFGLLRVVAMTRWQVRKTILTQAVLLAVAGLAPGVGGGLILSYIINLATLPAIGHPWSSRCIPNFWRAASSPRFSWCLLRLASRRTRRACTAEARNTSEEQGGRRKGRGKEELLPGRHRLAAGLCPTCAVCRWRLVRRLRVAGILRVRSLCLVASRRTASMPAMADGIRSMPATLGGNACEQLIAGLSYLLTGVFPASYAFLPQRLPSIFQSPSFNISSPLVDLPPA